ncbi:hypothetical protein [Streptomyces tibetensis]|uniref:hypothetical protein n=1 Tax=Streptomyces tibetensis TaxID=2382123 RepID=UPI0033C38A0A
MAWSAALPDAALRLPRTAAGWRALQLALMVGGLLVLGVLCAERASAENGAGALAEGRAGQVVSGVPVPGAGAGDRLVRSGGGAAEPVSKGPARARAQVPPSFPRVRSQSLSSERPSHLERPVRLMPAEAPELPGPPRQLSHLKLPPLPDPLDLSDLSAVPADVGLPGAPVLPALPLPELPDCPPAPPSRPLPTPVTADPQPGGTTVPVPYTPLHGTEPRVAPASPPTPVIHAHHGRRVDHIGHLGHTDRHRNLFTHIHHADRLSLSHSAQRAHPSHPRPSTHAGPNRPGHSPGGRPDGVLGNRSVADSGSSRHGDVHAVTPSRWAALGLVPGAVARTDMAGARRTHRGIPLFPG